MLILSRKRDEQIIIADDIIITVIEIRGDKVRLGIACDRKIPVHRREVWEAIQRGKEKPQSTTQENSENDEQPPVVPDD